jgi:hypothetical protein
MHFHTSHLGWQVNVRPSQPAIPNLTNVEPCSTSFVLRLGRNPPHVVVSVCVPVQTVLLVCQNILSAHDRLSQQAIPTVAQTGSRCGTRKRSTLDGARLSSRQSQPYFGLVSGMHKAATAPVEELIHWLLFRLTPSALLVCCSKQFPEQAVTMCQ